MKHKTEQTFFNLWEKLGYDSSKVKMFPISTGFEISDVAIIRKNEDQNYMTGDVVIYNDYGKTYIHRLFLYNNTHFVPVPDSTEIITPYDIESLLSDLKPISSLEGKVILKIPKVGLGWIAVRCLQSEKCKISDCLINSVCDFL
jgi:hypothetical protein